jgi:glycosyltransferase involved in cell wall biosynthesis
LRNPNAQRAPEIQNPKSKILWIWHAAVVAEYQKPLDVLGKCADLEMAVLVPRRWPERAGQMVYAEGPISGSYRFIKARTLFTGFYYVYFFPSLLYHLLRYRPHIIYCYEEAHTFISACVLLLRRIFMPRTRVLLYAAQNIKKRYPFPFRLFERYCFRRADSILACGTRVAETLRSKGYRGDLRVVPLPTDTRAFRPDPALRDHGRRDLDLPPDVLVIGYAGKLVEEKGLRTLWRAFAEVARERKDVHLALAGGGPLKGDLLAEADRSGLASRLHLPGVIHNDHLPAYMNALDVFVLPSETRPNWREQFGRVLVEAMACGVPVIGSNSGEIPEVVGDAGLLFPEGDVSALAYHLRSLLTKADLCADLSRRGREHVLKLFTIEQVAAQHYTIYQAMSSR